MPIKYSEDLRWRAVWLHILRGMSTEEISDVLFVSEKSVRRYPSLNYSTGDVAANHQQHGPQGILTEFKQISILQSLAKNPTMYLDELQSELLNLACWSMFQLSVEQCNA